MNIPASALKTGVIFEIAMLGKAQGCHEHNLGSLVRLLIESSTYRYEGSSII
jgi:hypothetical protein